MAILIVLIFTVSLLLLGTTYLGTFRQTKAVDLKSIDQVQADYIAQGLLKIATLKFKRFPADFYYAYMHEMARLRGATGAPFTTYNPTPLQLYHTQNAATCILQNQTGLCSPIAVATYSTTYRLISTKAFTNDALEIGVTVQIGSLVSTYRSNLLASRTRLIP